jgi:CubicO group peptidase (beta-lactamase class C family)
MKKADSFDAKQWLVENKITFQSRLNESVDGAQAALQEFVQEYKISSYACYVYKDGKLLFESFKNADMDSVFGLGSVSKGIDKIAIMKLVEMGKLKMDDTILQFGLDVPKDGINLVNYLNWEEWEDITIDHLMHHTSGIPDIINDIPEFNVHYGEFGKVKDPDKLMILRAVSKYPLKFKPGTGENYSNTNFWLLGKIIENVMDMSYGDAIKQLIFEPLGMKNTYWAYESTNPPGLIKSYVLDQNTNSLIKKFPIKPFDAWAIFYSTPEDMKKLAEAFLDNTLISKKTRDSFFDSRDNSPGQLGAIHDGFQCFWDVNIEQNCYYLLMINVFGQTVSDPMIDTMVDIRKELGIKVY